MDTDIGFIFNSFGYSAYKKIIGALGVGNTPGRLRTASVSPDGRYWDNESPGDVSPETITITPPDVLLTHNKLRAEEEAML